MSEFQGNELYRTRPQIVSAMQTAFQSAIPDVWLDDDGVLNIVINIEAGQIEGLYIANQIALQDSFIQTASIQGLRLWGEQLNVPQKSGTQAIGALLFGGSGGTYIPIGAEVAYDPGGGQDPLYFLTTQDGTIPDPGIPTAPTAAVGSSGTLTGTFEYAVTFQSISGESLLGAVSNDVVLATQQANISNIPLGGPGTTARNLYRAINGGAFFFITQVNDNSTTTYTDNGSTTVQVPPDISTAEEILLDAQGELAGSEYNAVPGSITILSNAPDGLTSVTNPNPFTSGSGIEDTDTFRGRLLDWIRGPQTGSPTDLVNWARTIPGVDSATCFPNYNGTTPAAGYATVMISGVDGTLSTSDQIAEVLALLQSKTLANITIVVETFIGTSQNVSVTITPHSGFSTAELLSSVTTAIDNYIASVDVAGTLYVTGLIAAIVAVPNVLDVSVTTPATNQTAAAQHKFIPGTITIT